MIDLTRFDESNIFSAVIALLAWAHFFYLAPHFAKRAGVAYEEPPVFLYAPTFKVFRWIALPIFLYVGLLFPLERSLDSYLIDQALPVGLGLINAAVVAAALYGLFALYRRWREKQEEVVLEPLSVGQIALRLVIVVGAVAVLAGLPYALENFLGLEASNIVGMMMGEGGVDATAFAALLLTWIFFWLGADVVEFRLNQEGASDEWAHASGLELFRWSWMGFTAMAVLGVFGAIPGPDVVFAYPVPLPLGFILPIFGALVFGLFWAAPMRSLAKKADEGDYLAGEMLPRVRFSGVVAWLDYKSQARTRDRRFDSEDAKNLCPTCLRPIGDIGLYKNLKFDECPHCGSYIPPAFTMMDFIKSQTERLLPLIEGEEVAGKKSKKRSRTVDEVNLVQDILRALLVIAVNERGTDLHLVTEGDRLIVRCRIDGVLYTLTEFSDLMSRPLISAMKVRANMDISERRKPQDGSFKMELDGRTVDVRVNTSPVGDGEMAAARLLYRQEVLGSVENLGMNSRSLNVFRQLIFKPSGLILVTGPTGSGKSTTLYNALQTIATGERNIITLEDPVEFQLKGLRQMQINNAKGFTFATGLRTILRQDPDVIMVGEIRDSETAKMAIDAAATGHLVFSTLHATDAVGVIGRLGDLDIDINRFAAVALATIAQRLLRLNCDRCIDEKTVTAEELAAKGLPGFPHESVSIYEGRGCPRCHESGFFGREGIYELLVPTDEIQTLIAEKATLAQIRSAARAQGMRTLLEDGLVKVLLGRTTIDELLRVTI